MLQGFQGWGSVDTVAVLPGTNPTWILRGFGLMTEMTELLWLCIGRPPLDVLTGSSRDPSNECLQSSTGRCQFKVGFQAWEASSQSPIVTGGRLTHHVRTGCFHNPWCCRPQPFANAMSKQVVVTVLGVCIGLTLGV